MRITTNNHRREVLDAWSLSADERAEFDYLDWPAIDRGEDSASFFRFRGSLHDLGEFSRDYGITRGAGLPDTMAGWDGYRSDSAFDAVLVRLGSDDSGEYVVVGHATW